MLLNLRELIQLVCLPELEKLHWGTWVSEYTPLSFGHVPSLGELKLSSASTFYNTVFKLSEFLHGTASIHTLTLDFQGENVSTSSSVCIHYYCHTFVFSIWSELS